MQTTQPIQHTAVCDFCSAVPVVKIYDAPPILVDLPHAQIHVLDTKWTACRACANLIDEDRWEELTDRAVATWHSEAQARGIRIGERDLRDIKEEMFRLHGSFREARKRTA
jgi:hypothetical protein